MKKVVLALMLVGTLIACKNNTKETEVKESTKQVQEIEKELVVKIRFKTNKKDIFRIMLNNVIVDDLQKKNIQVFEEVIPSTDVDQIIAKFDPDNISNNILINLGSKQVKKVDIESIFVSFGKNELNIKSAQDMSKYLVFNKFIDRDSTSTTLNTKKVDGKHNPVINFKRNVINLLKKE